MNDTYKCTKSIRIIQYPLHLFGVLLFFRFFPFAVDENEIVSVDLEGVALLAFFVFPGGGLDLALDIEWDALVYIGFDDVGCLVPQYDLVPFGFLDLVAFPVQVYFVGCQWEAGYFYGVIDLVYPGVVSDVAYKFYLVILVPSKLLQLLMVINYL